MKTRASLIVGVLGVIVLVWCVRLSGQPPAPPVLDSVYLCDGTVLKQVQMIKDGVFRSTAPHLRQEYKVSVGCGWWYAEPF